MQSLLLLVTTPGVTFTIIIWWLKAQSQSYSFLFLSFHHLMQKPLCVYDCSNLIDRWRIPPGGTPYNGLYGEAPPQKGTFSFRPQVYKRVRILQIEVYKRVGNRSFRYLVRVFNYSNISNKRTYGCISLFVKHYMKMTTRLPFSIFFHKTELQQLQIKLVGFFLHSIRVWSSVNAPRSLLCLLHLAVSVLQYSLNTLLGYN